MNYVYVICFILLGCGALGDLIAFIFLLLNNIGGNNSKSSISNSFKLFVNQPISNISSDTSGLHNEKSREE